VSLDEALVRHPAPKIGFVSLGCPKALTDSELILTQLAAEGYATSKTAEGATLFDVEIELMSTTGVILRAGYSANAEIAVLKARTAALTRRSSKTWEDRVAGGRLAMLKMPVLPVQGGLPIMVEDVCVGAVGVSGVQSHEDEQIAAAGIKTLKQ